MNYITNEGYRRITAQLKKMWFSERPAIVKAITTAAAEGDRSENAEYQYRKKEIRELDKRIRYIEKHLKDINIVLDKPNNNHKVFFGAWVSLEDIDTTEKITYRLVGMIESQPEKGEISIDSLVAKSLLGRSLGDKVTVKLPTGKNKKYIILNIHY